VAALEDTEGADATVVMLPDDGVKHTGGIKVVVVLDIGKGSMEVVREDNLSRSLESSPCSESNERCD
jgi:hypothetical protein